LTNTIGNSLETAIARSHLIFEGTLSPGSKSAPRMAAIFCGRTPTARIAETRAGQIMIGTDYPFPWNNFPIDDIMSIPGLSDDDKIAILGGTAAKLLGIAH